MYDIKLLYLDEKSKYTGKYDLLKNPFGVSQFISNATEKNETYRND